MSEQQPNAPFDNGRDAAGKFTKGNQAAIGRGNPHADQAKAVRSEFWKAMNPTYIRAAVNTLMGIMMNKQAKNSDRIAAARELLDRALGKPLPGELDESDDGKIQIIRVRAINRGQFAQDVTPETPNGEQP